MNLLTKRQVISLCLLFFVSLFIAFPQSRSSSQIENIWGVDKGDSRRFQIQKEVQGAVNEICSTIIIEYYVINNYDFDSNNISDLELAITDYTTTSNSRYTMELMDDAWWYWTLMEGWKRHDFENLFFKGFSNQSLINSIKRPTPLSWMFLVLALKGNDSIHCGVNWTYSIDYINVSMTDYSVQVTSDQVIINMRKINEFDSNMSTFYNVSGEIIWETQTGWLHSVNFIQTFDAPLSYSILITVDSLTSIYAGLALNDIICWIGFAFGITGLSFLIFVYYKYRKLRLEDYYNWYHEN